MFDRNDPIYDVTLQNDLLKNPEFLRPVYTGDFCGDFSHSDACY